MKYTMDIVSLDRVFIKEFTFFLLIGVFFLDVYHFKKSFGVEMF